MESSKLRMQSLNPRLTTKKIDIEGFNFTYKGKHRLKVAGWKRICHTNNKHKNGGIAIIISRQAQLLWTKQRTFR